MDNYSNIVLNHFEKLELDRKEIKMFCSKCGQQNDNSAKFCNNCGSPMINNLQINENEVEKQGYSTKIRAGARMSLIGALLGVVISFLFCLDEMAGGRIVLCLLYIMIAGISVLTICNVPYALMKIGSILNILLNIVAAFLVVFVSLGGIIQLFSFNISITFFYVPILVIVEVIILIGCRKTVTSVFSH